MKSLLVIALSIVCITAKAQLNKTELLDQRLNKTGEHLQNAAANFAWGLGVGVVGGTATGLTSYYVNKRGVPIGFAAITISLTFSFTISGIVNLGRAGKVANPYQ